MRRLLENFTREPEKELIVLNLDENGNATKDKLSSNLFISIIYLNFIFLAVVASSE